MTVSLSDIADALRWLWLALGVLWIAYSWLHRVAYLNALSGIVGLLVLDGLLHAFAEFAERPESNIPSDFALYSVVMLAAAFVGLFTASLFARWRRMDVLTVLEAGLVCVIAGGIGGRAYQVWTNWTYYSENADLIPDLSQGGFGMRGALVLGLLALVVFALLTRNSFWKLGDAAAVGLSLASSIGWYGAALTHMQYGIALDAPPPAGSFAPLAQIIRTFGYNFVQALPDAYNLIAFRVPVQMVACLFYLALFLLLLNIARTNSRRHGLVLACFLCLSGVGGFILGFWRGDETLFWNGLRVDQWIDLAVAVVGLALVWLHSGRAPISQRRVLQHA